MEIIQTGPDCALNQMQKDADLIENLAKYKNPLLRIYQWQKKTITYGHFIDPSRYIDQNLAAQFDIAKRPTGGGLIFHYDDFSFTLVIPQHHSLYSLSVLDSYRRINEILFSSCSQCHNAFMPYRDLCMATLSKYDLVWQNKKIGGSSQRRTKAGFVHQCSIFLNVPDWHEIEQIWCGPKEALWAMKELTGVYPMQREVVEKQLVNSFANML